MPVSQPRWIRVVSAVRLIASKNHNNAGCVELFTFLRTSPGFLESMKVVLLDLGGEGLSVDSEDVCSFGLFPFCPF